MSAQITELLRLFPCDEYGPMRESLCSLIIRTARENSTSPALLLEKKFSTGALDGLRCSSRALGSSIGQTINGSGPMAAAFVERAEQLTLLKNLRASTTLAFAPFATTNGLLRQHLAWSPEFLTRHPLEYYPLVWTLEPVRVCLKTRKPLISLCPACREPLPMLTGGSVVGRCYRCRGGLGGVKQSPSVVDPVVSQIVNLEYELWIADQLGEFIQFQTTKCLPPNFDYTATLKFWLDRFELSHGPKSAELLGVRHVAFGNWLAGKAIPKLRATMGLCWTLGLSLLQYLQRETPRGHEGRLRTPAEVRVRHASASSRRRIDRPALEARLTTLLRENEGAMLSFHEICCKKLKRKPEVVRQTFPELSRTISRRYLDNRRLMADIRRQQYCAAMRTIAFFLHGRAITPNYKTLTPYLDQPSKLRCAWAIEALREIRAELGYESNEEQLCLLV